MEVEEPLKCKKCTAVQEAAIANIIFTQDNMLLGDIKRKETSLPFLLDIFLLLLMKTTYSCLAAYSVKFI